MKFSPRIAVSATLLSAFALSSPILDCPAQAQAASAKPNFSSKKYGFSVWFPRTPQTGQRPLNQPGFSQKTVEFFYVPLQPNAVSYTVVPLQMPREAGKQPLQSFFNGVQTGILESSNGRTVASRSLTTNGWPSRHFEWIFSSPTQTSTKPVNFVGKARLFRRGSQSFQVLAVAPAAQMTRNRAQVDKVLNSFRLEKR